MSPMEESELDNFIDAIVRKSQEDTDSDRPLTRREMEELAYSMGLTETQFRELLVKSLRHVQTAERFLDQNNYEDGLVEAKNAVAINPYVEKGYSVLALAYYQRYQDLGRDEDLNQARFAANKALKLNSHDQRAINVISALSKEKRASNKDQRKIVFVIAGLVLAMGIGAAGFIALGKQVDAAAEGDHSGDRNQLIEAEETVNSIEMEIRVEEDRKKSLIKSFIPIAPEKNQAQIQAKAELQKIILAEPENTAAMNKAFLDYKNSFSGNISEDIQTHLIQIEGAENRIAFQRGELAKAIKQYNILVKKYGSEFPEFQLKEYHYE